MSDDLELPPRAEVDGLFAADPTDPDTTPAFGLTTIPAGSPAARMMRAELDAAISAAPYGSPQRELLESVRRGDRSLRDLLADPAFTPASTPRIGTSIGTALKDLAEGDPR